MIGRGQAGPFFLGAITVQSGTHVCGTKWSVMENRRQLHSGAQRDSNREKTERWMDWKKDPPLTKVQ